MNKEERKQRGALFVTKEGRKAARGCKNRFLGAANMEISRMNEENLREIEYSNEKN